MDSLPEVMDEYNLAALHCTALHRTALPWRKTHFLVILFIVQLYPMDLRSSLYSLTTCLVPLQNFAAAKVDW